MLDAGVNVVGEGEIGHPTPETYFDLMDVYVNREMEIGLETERTAPENFGEGEVFSPEEGVDRVVAMKLFTIRSAEFHYAEDKIGSLKVGKFADLVELGKGRASFSIYQTGSTKVLSTLLGGEFVRSINVSVKLWQVHYDPNRLF